MTGKTHILVGTLGLAAVSSKFGNDISIFNEDINPYIRLISVCLGSVLPDIDLQQSSIGNKYKFIAKRLTHRGITHTFLVPAILVVLMVDFKSFSLLNNILFGILFGWVTHIAADMLNRKGVPVLWPISNKRIHIMCIKTGKISETIFCIIYVIFCLLLML